MSKCESHPGVWVEAWCIVARRVPIPHVFDVYAHNCPRWVAEQLMRSFTPDREAQLVPYATAKTLISLLNG